MKSISINPYADQHVRAVEAKDAVLSVQESEGLHVIFEAVEQRKLDLISQLLQTAPSDQGADYADKLGRMKGLEELPLIVAGVIENGRRAEQALRDEGNDT